MKKIKCLLALAALPLLAAARPATPQVLTHVNPDGTSVQYRIHGDEHFNYITDVEGNNVLEFQDGRLVEVSAASSANIESMRAKKVARNATGNVHRMAALDNEGRTTYPTIGNIHGLVILLEFPDAPYSMEDPKAYYNRFCNEKGFSDYNAVGSAKDYYEASSNGKFSPTFDVYGPVKLKHSYKWYVGKNDLDGTGDDPNLYQYGHNARLGYAIQEAFEALDDEINFADYDLDKDGTIDNIFFFYSGYGQADTRISDYIWPHQFDYYAFTAEYADAIGMRNSTRLPRLFGDGVEMRTYACTNELSNTPPYGAQRPYVDGIGAFCHEYGHVLGLPDLYDTNTSNGSCKSPGDYSVMDNGSYNLNSTCPPIFSAYEQWVCKWLDYTVANDEGEQYTMHPLNTENRSALKVRVPRGSNAGYYTEYFVVECRDYTGWDRSLPDHGMFIWRINYNNSTWTSNKVNDTTPNVEILSVPGSTNYHGWPGEFMDNTYITPSQNVLVPATTKKAANYTFSQIKYDPEEDNILTFNFNIDKETEDVTVLHDKPMVDNSKREVYLKWDPVEGATDYALTLYYKDSKGNNSYVEGLNDKLIGNRTEYTVRNISEANWSKMHTAYVRVVKGVPGKNTSNTVSFNPMRMPDVSGVEVIETEATVVYTGPGCIYAPEGAKIYNLNGIETGRENLPAGIYIVIVDGKSIKVAVK